MAGWRSWLMQLDRRLSRHSLAIEIALRVRNHSNLVVANALTNGRDPNPRTNGEGRMCATLAPTTRRFVDVGANVGAWTEHFLGYAEANVRGILFEPSPVTCAQLRERFGADARLEIVEAAVGDSVGTAQFFEHPTLSENSSLVPLEGVDAYEVSVTTLAEELGRRGWEQVDFIKIDAEGYDLRVLEGVVELLELHAIDVVQFEYNHAWAATRSTLAAALNLLERLDYEVFLLTARGLCRYDYARWQETFAYANFVAVARGRLPRVARLIGDQVGS